MSYTETVYRLQRQARWADAKGEKMLATTARKAIAMLAKLKDQAECSKFGVTRLWSDHKRSAETIAATMLTTRTVMRCKRSGVYATSAGKVPESYELVGTYHPGVTAEQIIEDMLA